jgi:hypothetical protein
MRFDGNELAARLKHEGIRAGEIIAYRAWRVIVQPWEIYVAVYPRLPLPTILGSSQSGH